MNLQALRRARNWVDLENESIIRAMTVAAPYAKGALIDVGCGDKPYEPLFAPHVTKYVGVEYADTYNDSANANVGKADVVYSEATLPFERESFETVLCNQVAEHVPDPDPFIADLARVLKVGGRLILTVPFSYRIHSAPNDFHRFTKFGLAHYCQKYGLEIDLLEPRGLFWSVVGQKLAAHLALKISRMEGEIQRTGAFGYIKPVAQRPRYWTLPFTAPAILGITAAARVLDSIDPDDSDTLGYLLVATKRGNANGKAK